MKTLTNREEEIMNHYWEHGDMHIRELQALYADPKPHVNTLSTLVHILEDKGFLAHKAITPRCYKYYAVLSRDDYRRGTLGNVVNKFFGQSYLNQRGQQVLRAVIPQRGVGPRKGRENIR